MENMIARVLEVENAAAGLVAGAREHARDIIARARAEAVLTLETERQRHPGERAALISRATEDAMSLKREALEQASLKAEQMRQEKAAIIEPVAVKFFQAILESR